MPLSFQHWEDLLASHSYIYVRRAIQQIQHVIQSYGGVEAISLCFNGGKDCTVLLHLLAYVLYQMGANLSQIPITYFKVDQEFNELYQFNNDMMALYGFKLVEFDGRDMKQCLQQMLEAYPTVRVIFMGQRRTDPHGANLSLVQKSDPGWPAIDRANSILDWSYKDVWDFLLDFQLPYCRLYELGFTSLGSLQTTIPNPWLLKAKLFFTPIVPAIAPPATSPPVLSFPSILHHHSPFPRSSSTTTSTSDPIPMLHLSQVSTCFEFPTKYLPCVQCIQQSNLDSPKPLQNSKNHLHHFHQHHNPYNSPQLNQNNDGTNNYMNDNQSTDSLSVILSQQPNIHRVSSIPSNNSFLPSPYDHYEISFELFNSLPLLLQRALSTSSATPSVPTTTTTVSHFTPIATSPASPAPKETSSHILNLVRLHTRSCSQPSIFNGSPYNSNSPIGTILISSQQHPTQIISHNPTTPSHSSSVLSSSSSRLSTQIHTKCQINPHYSPNTIQTDDIQSIFKQSIPSQTQDGHHIINLSFWPYLPAYLLTQSDLERDCRIQQPPKITHAHPQSLALTTTSSHKSAAPTASLPATSTTSPPCRTCELKQQQLDPINSNLNVLKFMRVQSDSSSTATAFTAPSVISLGDLIPQADYSIISIPSLTLPATSLTPSPTPHQCAISTTHPTVLMKSPII